MSRSRPDGRSLGEVTAAGRPLRVVTESDARLLQSSGGGGLVRGRVRALVLCDLLALAVAFAGTYVLAELIGPPAVIGPTAAVVGFVLAATVTWIGVFSAYRLYEG